MKQISPNILLPAVIRRIGIDSTQDVEYLTQRDSLIRQALPLKASAYRLLQEWIKQLDSLTLGKLSGWYSRIYKLAFVLGVLLGLLAVSASIALEAPMPVNLVVVVILLLLIPLFFLVLSFVFVMPLSFTNRLSIISNYSRFFENIFPFDTIFERLAGTNGLETDGVFGNYRGLIGASRHRRWLVLSIGQLVGLGYALGACVSLLFVVAVSDVAFVWSTTFDISSESVHKFLETVSLPWSCYLPQAVPTYELVENTRYYRMQSAVENPEIFGSWWPFLLCAILFYGVFPRLLTFYFSLWRSNVAAQNMIFSYPGVANCQLRLRNEIIHKDVKGHNIEQGAEPEKNIEITSLDSLNDLPNLKVIFWAFASTDKLSKEIIERFSLTNDRVYYAGGKRSSDEDEKLVEQVLLQTSASVVVVVRAYEPPLKEGVEFIKKLAQGGDLSQPVILALSQLPNSVHDQESRSRQIEIWRAALGTSVVLKVLSNE